MYYLMMMRRYRMEPKINTKSYGSNGRSFETNVEMCRTRIEHYERPLRQKFLDVMEQQGLVFANLIWRLMKIDGVVEIFVEPYEISIRMAPTFNWNREIDTIVGDAVKKMHNMGSQVKGKKIVIVTFPNQVIREYHTNFEVSKSHREQFYRPLRLTSLEPLMTVGIDGGELIRMLFKMDGVCEVTVYPYIIRISIGDAFDWQPIEAEIFDAVQKVFGKGLVVSGKSR